MIAMAVGRRREGFLRAELDRVSLFEQLQEIEKLYFELDRGKQTDDHRFAELEQCGPIDVVICRGEERSQGCAPIGHGRSTRTRTSEDFLEGAQIGFAQPSDHNIGIPL